MGTECPVSAYGSRPLKLSLREPPRRNRQAEGKFLRLASSSFGVAAVPDSELHDVYQTVDVTVLRLRKQRNRRQAPPAE
jgi:hypothetical protein